MVEIDGQTFAVTDAHCHIFPEAIATRAVAGTDGFYAGHILFADKGKSQYDGTVSSLLSRGGAVGIDSFVVQSVATKPHQVKGINEFIAAAATESGGRIAGLGTLHPDSDDLAGEVRHIKELGLHGVKLHPDIQQFKIDDFRALKIYEICEKEGLPILMHTGDSRFDYSNPNRLKPVMKIFTGLVVVGAHFGGWSVWDEAAQELAELPNLYVDTSSTFPFVSAEEAKRLVASFGVDKILFGTDYPMWNMEEELAGVAALSLPADQLRKVLHDNAAKVFSLEKLRV